MGRGSGPRIVMVTRPDGTELVACERCLVADTALSRLRGMLGRRQIPAGEGLLLRPANAVHMFFMRFAIDAVFLDRRGYVVDVVPGLRPWRWAARRGAREVLELREGEAARRGVVPGLRITLK